MTKLSDLEPQCKDCRCWDGDDEPDDDGDRWGWCRHGPGQAYLSDDQQVVTVLPVKRHDEWCAQLRPRN